jgi:hypothetical protein
MYNTKMGILAAGPHARRSLRRYLIAAIAVVAVVWLIPILLPLLIYRIERAVIFTGPNGPVTPASFGVAYERARIASANHFLDFESSTTVSFG